MNLTSCPSRPKIASPCYEILRNRDMNILLSTPVTKVLDFNKKDSRFVVCKHHDAEKFVLSGHFQGSCVGNKQSQEPNRKLKFVRTLLIDNYDSYTFNIFQELSVVNGVPPVVIRNDEWTWEDICFYLYEEKAFDNIVISPGPGSPACPADIGICLRLLLECRDIPILGVCLGHQALGYVHGGRVVHASEAIHGRLSEIEHNGCSLFYEIPTGKGSGFKVVRYHSLVLDAESLPKELVPIAWTVSSQTLPFFGTPKPDPILDAYESQTSQQICVESLSTRFANGSSWLSCGSEGIRNRKVLMGIMHSTRPHYGLQFHPESVASCFGRQIFKNFREMTKDYWFKLTSLSTCEKEVPHVCQLFREVPGRMPLLNKSDKRNHFNLSSTTNIPCSRNGVKFFKLRWRKLDSLVSRVGGARNIFCILFGDHKAGNSFWLDSSSTEKRRARFSFMGGKGGSLWKQLTFRLSYQSDIKFKGGGYLSVEYAEGSTKSMYLEDGFFDYLNKELQSFRFDKKDCEGLPFDFCSGYVGYIGYDLKIECGMAANCHKSRAPDACFFFADNLVVIDHLCDDVYVLSLHDESTGMTHWLEDVERKLHNVKAGIMEELMYQMSKQNNNEPLKQDFLAEKSKEQYIKDIEKCQKFIKDGESYELCLTTQMRNKIGEIDYLGLYLKLREKNPAPYAAWLNFSKENLCICCSSPERFLRLDRYGTLEAKPIKGTIARSVTEEEDKLLKLQLQYSEKDQAENLMIVDLLRNDLGRVCEPGSVHVPHLMEVESYATVHTMVSTIRGKKRANVSAVDCVRAAFPGGSMTGAPKLRSMEILDSLESCSRGIYSGCIGFFSYNQTFDLNIVIRTIVIRKGEASVGAGGAIVSLSNPEDEYKEMILKTRAPVDAVKEYQRGLQFES